MSHDRTVEAVLVGACLSEYPTNEAAAEMGLAALGANGYVVVPRHLLDELLRTARYASNALRLSASAPVGSSEYELAKLLDSTAAAVVEAVGPTT